MGLSRQDAINQFGSEQYTAWDPTAAAADFKAKGGQKGNQTVAGDQAQQQQQQTTQNVVDSAQKLQDFYKQQNQPIVQQLQGQLAPGSAIYQQGTANISNQYQDTINSVIANTTKSLGQRGINVQDPYAQQQINQAKLPYTNQEAGALTGAQSSYQNWLNTVNSAIGQAQSGNPNAAVNSALGAYNLPQQQQLIAAQAQQAGYVPTAYGVYNIGQQGFAPNSGIGAITGVTPITTATGQTVYRQPNGAYTTTPTG